MDVAAGIALDMSEFVDEPKVGGDAAGLGVGGDNMPFVAVVVGDFGEVVADFCEGEFGGDVVFARCRVKEIGSFLRGELEEWSGCQEAENQSWQNARSWVVGEFVG